MRLSRRGVLKGLLGTALAGLLSALWGFVVEPMWRLRVQRWRIARPDWTAGPLRIVVIGDLHVGLPQVGLAGLRRWWRGPTRWRPI